MCENIKEKLKRSDWRYLSTDWLHWDILSSEKSCWIGNRHFALAERSGCFQVRAVVGLVEHKFWRQKVRQKERKEGRW